MEKWKRYKLCDLVQRNICYGIVQPGECIPNGVPIVKVNNIISRTVNVNSLERTSQEISSRYSRTILNGGELLISVVGSPGKCMIAPSNFKGANIVRAVAMIDIEDKNLSEWVYYYFTSNEAQQYLEIRLNTTVQATLNIKELAELPIPVPSFDVRYKIVSVLKSIDTKIELNRRINDNLEQQAQALFKSWFVENASYSGVSISEYFLPNRGKNLLVSDAKGGITPVVAGGLTPSAFHNVANTKAPVITISASGANAGFVNLWGIPVWAADSSYIDSTIVSNIYFWYNLLKYNQKNIYESQTGSAQPHIYPKHIGNLLIPDLDMRKVECYESIVTSMYLQINEIQQETKFLSDLRDTLLPKLMSGELKINDLNC